MWGVQHLAVRADRWGPVITSQLASNAFGRVVPGGVAASGALQYSMLVRGGVPAAAAASGMTASSLLLFGTLLALPLLALPAVLGGVAVDPHLTRAALAGAALFVLMVRPGRGVHHLGPAADRRRPRLPGDPQPDPQGRRAAHGRARAPAARARHRRPRAREGVVGGADPRVGPLAARLPHARRGRLRGRRPAARLAGAARVLRRAAAGHSSRSRPAGSASSRQA